MEKFAISNGYNIFKVYDGVYMIHIDNKKDLYGLFGEKIIRGRAMMNFCYRDIDIRFFLSLKRRNRYKKWLIDIYNTLYIYENKFALIGIDDKSDKSTINHELSHAFYYLHEKYRDEQDANFDKIPIEDIYAMSGRLRGLGYKSCSYKEEIISYLSSSSSHCISDKKIRNAELVNTLRKWKSRLR